MLLSTLGFYEMYVGALADVNLQILLPMVGGLAVGAVAISFVMSTLFKRFYTGTYCIIFGIFLTMIPNMLSEKCVLGWDSLSAVSLMLAALGFLVSWYLGDLSGHNARLRLWLAKRRKRG